MANYYSGVQAVETDMSSGKLTVTGTMTGDKLVDYIFRRTGKLAKVIPSPPPPPPHEEEKKDEGKSEEQKPPEEKKEEKPTEQKKEDNAEKKEEEKAPEAPPPSEAAAAAEEKKEEKKEGELGVQAHMQFTGPEDMMKRMMYWNAGYNGYNNYMGGEDDFAKRMAMSAIPVYVIERPVPLPLPPPPQMFSDENPNACCIS